MSCARRSRSSAENGSSSRTSFGCAGDRARERDALRLAAGERARAPVREVPDAERVEQRLRLVGALGPRRPRACRTRRSAARSCAGTARGPGTRTTAGAGAPARRCRFARSSQTVSPSATRAAIRAASARRARARIVLLPEPDGPITHVMPGGHDSSTSSVNSPRVEPDACAARPLVSTRCDCSRRVSRFASVQQRDADDRRHERHVARAVLVARRTSAFIT